MNFEQGDPKKKGMNREGFLKTLGAIAFGAPLPKFMSAETKKSPETMEKKYFLFNREIRAVLTEQAGTTGEETPFYFNMHDNEQTSVNAAIELLNEYGGKLLELRHNGKRLINFTFNGRTFYFDPNRIFTGSGIRQTLEKYNKTPYSEEVYKATKTFADQLLNDFSVKKQRVVIALHNNSEGTYSIRDYRKGGAREIAAKNLYENPTEDADNFFYVTNEKDFEDIKKLNYNVILQSENVPDDGSLSVVAGQNKIRYINADTEHNHERKQKEMLHAIQPMLSTGSVNK